MASPTDEFTAVLGDFADRIDHVWEQYEDCGPGGVDSAVLRPIEQLAEQLGAMLEGSLPADVDRAAVGDAIDQATDLARRCVTLPQGLCFVSGEAGLVPRRDQIDAFTAARVALRLVVSRPDSPTFPEGE